MKRKAVSSLKISILAAAVLLAELGFWPQAAALDARAAEKKEAELVTVMGVPGSGCEYGMKDKTRLAFPMGMDIKDGRVMIADTDNNQICDLNGSRAFSAGGRAGERDEYGRAIGGYADGFKSSALMNRPTDCLFLEDGRIAIADQENHAVRVLGVTWIYTIAGTGEAGYQEQTEGIDAQFFRPTGLAGDGSGNIYVADTGNHCIRRITKEGKTSLVAGVPGTGGMRDGACEEALFLEPEGVAVAEDGSIYVADTGNQRICRIADGQVVTLAGGSGGVYLDTEYRQPGYRDGQGHQALFRFPKGICIVGEEVLVADTGNHVIRRIAPDGTVSTIAGTGEPGWRDGNALEAELNSPSDLAWEDGTLYIMDSGNSSLRKMNYELKQQKMGE